MCHYMRNAVYIRCIWPYISLDGHSPLRQLAKFSGCHFHGTEKKQSSREMISLCEKDPNKSLELKEQITDNLEITSKKKVISQIDIKEEYVVF